MSSPITISFKQMAIAKPVLQAIEAIGYELPTPIQEASIPPLLGGQDLIGMAQTGTGKTAAFALPLLSSIKLSVKSPQVLVLTPTRELAIQVAEAFQKYAAKLSGFHVLPIYGGQEYATQLRQLKRGPHVVVGTPGRVMDHLRRKTLKLESLKCLVLDEADEMLRMGFIEDVEWILEHTPENHQTALFSATMPTAIRKVARKYLKDPCEVKIASKASTGENIDQHFWMVGGTNKLDALTRILEVESIDAMLIFVRTKTATVELAEKLEARGYPASALNGDMSQQIRERTIDRLRNKKLDILVATDVAARGIDVSRISHVLNYDIPHDSEAYIHRIGRTGRAGRQGKAILFVAPREKRLLHTMEKASGQSLTRMELPTGESISKQRIDQFKQVLSETINNQDLSFFDELLAEYSHEHDIAPEDIAAALAYLHQKKRPLKVQFSKPNKDKSNQKNKQDKSKQDKPNLRKARMVRYKIAVGKKHKITVSDIIGILAREAGLNAKHIGEIDISEQSTSLELPEGIPKEVYESLRHEKVHGHKLNITQDKSAVSTKHKHKHSKRDENGVKKRKKKQVKANKNKKSAKRKKSGTV
ncbi:MAG: DEAD/DEAH box helicase [Gammaproteobacteria bacterium]|nr:DEAD/DEAH box helicase [Gammaproteobacteria bacterium]